MKSSAPATRTRERRGAETLPMPLPGAVTRTGLVLPAGLPRERWVQVGQTLRKIAGAVQWWVGDWLCYGQEASYISRSRYDAAEEVTGYAAKSLRNLSYVARAVESSLRRGDLEWHHHALVAPLPAADQAAWLAKAKDNAWSVAALRRALAEARADGAPPWLCCTDVWRIPDCDERFGMEYPGRIPGQIVQNVLWYFTEPGALVVDPMAGGGTTLDVCRAMDRRCVAFDLAPPADRPDILRADALEPWPVRGADLVFLDPPYWSQQEDQYGGLAQAPSAAAFIAQLGQVMGRAAEAAKPDAVLALLLAPMAVKAGEYHNLPLMAVLEAARRGWQQTRGVCVPVSTEQVGPSVVAHCRRTKTLVAVDRDLLIFQRGTEDGA